MVVAAHGRFHAFDLVRGLIESGQDVTLLTNLPKSHAARLGLPRERVRCFPLHAVASRLAQKVSSHTAEPLLHRVFGEWAARQIEQREFNAVHLWSSIAAEWLIARSGSGVVHRGSAHIRTQRRLLDEEEKRAGVPIDKPTDWMVDREEAEYARASMIVVPSEFARRSFQEQGVNGGRVVAIPLAGPASIFEASDAVIDARIQRLLAHQPLRVLYVGAVSYQKGMFDLEHTIQELAPDRFDFRIVGRVLPECQALAQRLRGRVTFTGALPMTELPTHYNWADLFVMPTIQDGFAVVLTQAAAAAVPIIASTNSGGPELITGGAVGWVLPPRNEQLWAAALREVDASREQVVDRIRSARGGQFRRSWQDVAQELISYRDTRLGKLD